MTVFAQFAGEVLTVEDAPRVLEGSWPYSRTVLLRFPSEAALKRWYDSETYQEVVLDRRSAAWTMFGLKGFAQEKCESG